MHKVIVGVVLMVAGGVVGCSQTRDPAIERIEGEEPQRLSFGTPETVKLSFMEKMRLCWFGGATPVLNGYRYDVVAAPAEDGGDNPQQHIKIHAPDSSASDNDGFLVQFHSFNENTLITTKNLSLPLDLAARLKRDVETWIFARGDCGAGYRPQGTPPAATQPGWSATPLQHAATVPPVADPVAGQADIGGGEEEDYEDLDAAERRARMSL